MVLLMKNQSSNWMHLLPLGFVVAALFGFSFSQRKPTQRVDTKPWGVLSQLWVGERLENVEKAVHGADTVRRTKAAAVKHLNMQVRWERGDHLLILVFVERRLASASEVRFVRDQHGQVVTRDWQGLSASQPDLETGQL
jgi:hypothetical protein